MVNVFLFHAASRPASDRRMPIEDRSVQVAHFVCCSHDRQVWSEAGHEAGLFVCSRLAQGSPTFLKLRATSCVPINAKGY